MNSEKGKILRISGAGSASGGKFDEVRISGAGDVSGDIECNFFKSSGASEVRGNVNAKAVEVSGASEIKGDLVSENVNVSGASKIQGNVTTRKIRVSGATDIKGSLHADEVEIRGAINIEKDCEAESFKANGGFEINGLLNADKIDISIYGKCKVKEIGGGKIEVRQGKNPGFDLVHVIRNMFNKPAYLFTELIEGDDIILESATVKTVRGNNVTIGRNCEIDIVEYKGELKIIDGGNVREKIKL